MPLDAENMNVIYDFIRQEVTKQTALVEKQDALKTAVTQYVGARYVPLFADPLEWDNERMYEPLTIVLHGGNSFTSRQYVPTGIDINDETFWALTGSYNAQVEQYRTEVMEYQQNVLNFDSRISTAQNTANAATQSAISAQTTADNALSLARTNEGDIFSAQATADNALSLARTNEGDISAIDAQLAGTAESGLMSRIVDIENSIAKLVSAKTYNELKENGFLYKAGE